MGKKKMWVYLLPKKALTAMVGSFSRRRFSRYLIPLYIRLYNIDVAQTQYPISQYPSLAAFFSRGLKQDARPLEDAYILSPVDGTVQGFGDILQGQLLQAKGSFYSVAALLGSPADARRFIGGRYVTLYLSPRDYHRIHMPIEAKLTSWRYIPGQLFPVNKAGISSVDGLFTKNERLVTFCNANGGELAIVKIGATIVGSVRTSYGPMYGGPFSKSRRSIVEGTVERNLTKGEEMGYFEFGSTVIVLFSPSFRFNWSVVESQFLKMGQSLGTMVSKL